VFAACCLQAFLRVCSGVGLQVLDDTWIATWDAAHAQRVLQALVLPWLAGNSCCMPYA
jgi:hypothetical protein